MERINAIRRPILRTALILAAALTIVSCGNNNTENENNSIDVVDAHDDTPDSTYPTDGTYHAPDSAEMDAQFLVDAADISTEEIMLGQLAQKNGKASHVKELGKMMESDHTQSLNELTALANKEAITIPSSTDKAEDAYQKLKDESPADFDKEYCDMMVNGHKDAVALFEKASAECVDPDIQAWATATLPTLRKHLDHAVACQKKVGKK